MSVVIVICARCETEWDADELSPQGPCPSPACGYVDQYPNGDAAGENVIRVDRR